MTRFLTCSLACLILSACRSDYAAMKHVDQSPCPETFNPIHVVGNWFNTSIDVEGHHLSGILILKQMQNGSVRTVFTSETGITFFDFEFIGDEGFKVHSILSQFDRKYIVQTLRKDFELLIGRYLKGGRATFGYMNNEHYIGNKKGKSEVYKVIDYQCKGVNRVELRSNNTKMVSVHYYGDNASNPDSLSIQHHTFEMQINLVRLEKP